MPHKTAEEWDQAFAEAFSSCDVDALLALYEPKAVWVTEPGQSVQGAAAMAEAAAGYFALKPSINLTTKGVLDAGDIVVAYSGWTLTATGDDGRPLEMAGDSTVVLRRQPDGSLLCVVDDPWSSG
jgi:ketosteroid isomerase-like protein